MLFCASCAETPASKLNSTTDSEVKSTSSKSSSTSNITADSSKSFNEKLEVYSSEKPSAGKSQVFKYKKLNSSNDEFIEVERKKIVDGDDSFLVAISSSGGTRLDSTVFNYDNLEVMSAYMFDAKDKPYQIEFKLNENAPNDATASFVNDKMNFRMEILYNIKNDTSYTWKGANVDAIYVTEQNKVESKESNKVLRSYPGYSIYAKDLGRVRYGTNINGEKSEYELVSKNF